MKLASNIPDKRLTCFAMGLSRKHLRIVLAYDLTTSLPHKRW